MSHVLFILVCCIWGTSFLLMKVAVTVFGPFDVSLLRSFTGASALLVIWRVTGKRWPFRFRDLPHLLLIATVGYAIPYSLQPYVIEQVPTHGSAFAGQIIALVPIFTTITQALMLRKWPTRLQWIGVIGGLGGMIFLGWEELSQGVPLEIFALAAVTPLGYATANTYVKKRFSKAPTVALSASAMTLSACILLPISFNDQPIALGHESFVPAAACVLTLGLVATGLATWLFYKLIQNEGPLFAGMVGYIIPSVAMILGAASGEAISSGQIVALLLVFVMVALVQLGSATNE